MLDEIFEYSEAITGMIYMISPTSSCRRILVEARRTADPRRIRLDSLGVGSAANTRTPEVAIVSRISDVTWPKMVGLKYRNRWWSQGSQWRIPGVFNKLSRPRVCRTNSDVRLCEPRVESEKQKLCLPFLGFIQISCLSFIPDKKINEKSCY